MVETAKKVLGGDLAPLWKLLAKVVPLDDGTFGYIFTEQGNHKSQQKKYMCHVCRKIIISVKALFVHAAHPNHKHNLALDTHPKSHFTKTCKTKPSDQSDGEEDEMDESGPGIVPGEPVPPGLEGIVDTVCQIQATFDAYKTGPLIGLEYIVELVSSEEKCEPRYICLLCEKKGDPRSVMVHVTSYNHYLKYICCFFRTVGNKLNMMPKSVFNRRVFNTAVLKVAEAIEKHYGRLKPTSAEMETFSVKKFEILREIDEREHFRETPTTTFLELITADKMKEYSNIIAQKVVPPPSNTDENEIPKVEKKVEQKPNISDNKTLKPTNKVLKNDEGPSNKKLCISISKPERSIPGVTKTTVQNQPTGGETIIPPVKVEKEEAQSKEEDDDDDVIILPDDDKDVAIEVESLSSISTGSMGSRSWSSRDRSRSTSRRRHHRSPNRYYSRYDRRSRSRDRYRSRRRGDSRSRRSEYRREDRGRRDEFRRREDDRLRREERYRREEDRYRRDDDRARFDRRRDRSDSRSRRTYESEERIKQIEEERRKRLKWDAYKEELAKLETEMNNNYKYFQSRPEKHQMYSEEWKSFWSRRYKEIQMSGQDPSKYDFKPEWILYWEKKMKELHEQECIMKKEELKRKHNLDELKDIRYSHDLQDVSPPTPEADKDVTVSDIKKTWKALTGSDITAPSSKRSPSPWESGHNHGEKEITETSQNLAPPAPSGWRVYSSVPVPPVIHCLRMLSVLETQLGFQAARVMELLSQALALEKTRPSGSMLLLQNKDIYLLFETLKEKLRGQLMAGVVLRHLVPTTRSVIKAIDSMLASNPLKPEVFEPVTIPGVGAVDKVAVAQKIASAIVKLGKTNVNQEELEQLINAVVGMANASSISSDISSDSFFSQLNIKDSNASSHINNIISSMILTAQQSVGDTSQVELAIPIKSNSPPKDTTVPLDNLMVSDNMPIQELSLPSPSEDNIDHCEETGPIKESNLLEIKNDVRAPSPFSLRSGGINPARSPEMKNPLNITAYGIDDDDDEDDDDYSFEEVYNAASQKLKLNEAEKKPAESIESDNSQTQSSVASNSLANPFKAVTDLFSSLKSTQSSISVSLKASDINSTVNKTESLPLIGNETELEKTSLSGVSTEEAQKSSAVLFNNLAALSQNISFNKPVASVSNTLDNSLVASIKNSLVESLNTVENISTGFLHGEVTTGGIEKEDRNVKPRPVLDPRARKNWDLNLRGIIDWKEDTHSRTDVNPGSRPDLDPRSLLDSDPRVHLDLGPSSRVDLNPRSRLDVDVSTRLNIDQMPRSDLDTRSRIELDGRSRLDQDARSRLDSNSRPRFELDPWARQELNSRTDVDVLPRQMSDSRMEMWGSGSDLTPRSDLPAASRTEFDERLRGKMDERMIKGWNKPDVNVWNHNETKEEMEERLRRGWDVEREWNDRSYSARPTSSWVDPWVGQIWDNKQQNPFGQQSSQHQHEYPNRSYRPNNPPFFN